MNNRIFFDIITGGPEITEKCQIENNRHYWHYQSMHNIYFNGIILTTFFLDFIQEILENNKMKSITFRNTIANFEFLQELLQIITFCGYKIHDIVVNGMKNTINSNEFIFDELNFAIFRTKVNNTVKVHIKKCLLNMKIMNYISEILTSTTDYSLFFTECESSFDFFKKILDNFSKNNVNKAKYILDDFKIFDISDQYYSTNIPVIKSLSIENSWESIKAFKNAIIDELEIFIDCDNSNLFDYISEFNITVRKITILMKNKKLLSQISDCSYFCYGDELIENLTNYIKKGGSFEKLLLFYLPINDFSNYLLTELINMQQLKSLKIFNFINFENTNNEYQKIIFIKLLELINDHDYLTELIVRDLIIHRTSGRNKYLVYSDIVEALRNNCTIKKFGNVPDEFCKETYEILRRNIKYHNDKNFIRTKTITNTS